MSDNLGTFSDAAKTLSRNPLGIVALFIVLVYAMAALVLGTAASGLGMVERFLLVLFLVLFPPIVLLVFRELVIEHTGKLYGPSDIADLKAAKAAMELWKSQTAPTRAAAETAEQASPASLFSAARVAALVAENASRKPRILWVDDVPAHNTHERRAFEAAGYVIETALNTDEGLTRARDGRFDVIISDMGRPEGPRAGYDLLDRLRAAGITTPYVIYAGSAAPEHRAEAQQHGAVNSTNSPAELFQIVAQIAAT